MEICTSAFSEVLSNTKLRGVWATYDFSELVEWFARSCQSSSQVEHGWLYIYKLVDHIKQVLPILLLFRADSYELADLKKLERLSKDPEFFCKACFLLHSVGEVLKLVLHQVQV